MVQAGLMAETYGYLPTEVLDQPAGQFWLNARVRQATNVFKNEQREAAQQGGDAGVATQAEKNELVQANEERADRREDLGDAQPPLADQMAALQEREGGS